MRAVLWWRLALGALAVVCSACHRATPTAPSTPPARPTAPLFTTHPPETIAVGDTVRASVSSDDPHCDTADPRVEDLEAPCRSFQFTAPGSGILTADLTWDSRSIFMELLTPAFGRCCTAPLRLQFGVIAGQPYTVSVGFHGVTGAGPEGIAPFELTISLTQ